MEWLETIDKQLTIFINSFQNPLTNEFMWFVSGKFTFLPLIVFYVISIAGYSAKYKNYLVYYTIFSLCANFLLSYFFVKSKIFYYIWLPLVPLVLLYIYHWRKALAVTLFTSLVVLLADRISVEVFKDVICRYRPSHNLEIKDHLSFLHNYRGGMYGFVSSHAANVFGLATFFALCLKHRKHTLIVFAWAFMVALSRVYLGVHYVGDVVAGALLGMVLGFVVVYLYKIFRPKIVGKY